MKKMLVWCTLLLMCAISIHLFADSYDFSWAKSAGGSGGDYGQSIAVDADGNSYVSGYFEGTAIFGGTTLTSSGGTDIFIAKMNAVGNWQWVKQAGGTAWDYGYGIAVDSAGNCYVTGAFVGSALFGEIPLVSNGLADIFVAKLDTGGNWLWAQNFGYANHDRGFGIGVDEGGDCYVTGEIYVSSRVCVFIGKWTTNGAQLWWDYGYPSSGASPNSSGRGIAVSSSGSCFITGRFDRNIQFGTGGNQLSLSGSGSDDIFIAKLNSSGTWQWARKAGGSVRDQGYGIALDAEGNCYATGWFASDPAVFGGSSLVPESGKLFVSKLDDAGNWQWTTQAGSNAVEQGLSIIASSDGNCCLTGMFSGICSFGDQIIQSNSNSVDMFVACLNTSGEWLWGMRGGGASEDHGYGITLDNEANCYVTGYFRGLNAAFGSNILVSSGNQDVYITKLFPVYTYLPLTPMPLQLEGGTLVTIEVLSGTGFNSGELGLFPPVNNPGGADYSFALFGYGVQSFEITTTLLWGAAYFNGQWHSFPNLSGKISFLNVDFGAAKGGVPIILGDEDSTLPVTLSSFSAIASGVTNVKLNWITETETGVLGYKVFRNNVPNLETALLVSPLIEALNSSTQTLYSYEDTETEGFGTYHYWLQSLDFDGHIWFHGPTSITLMPGHESIPVPQFTTKMHSVYPNPFNPNLVIPFYLDSKQNVSIQIFNILGQLVRNLSLGSKDIGFHHVAWDGMAESGKACPSGIYEIVLKTGVKSFQSKAVLLK